MFVDAYEILQSHYNHINIKIFTIIFIKQIAF